MAYPPPPTSPISNPVVSNHTVSVPTRPAPSAPSPSAIAIRHRRVSSMTLSQIDLSTLRMKHNLKQTESKMVSIRALESRVKLIIERVQGIEREAGGMARNEKEKEILGVVTRRRARSMVKVEKAEVKEKVPLSKEVHEEIDSINAQIASIKEEIGGLEEEVYRETEKANAEWAQKIADELVADGKE